MRRAAVCTLAVVTLNIRVSDPPLPHATTGETLDVFGDVQAPVLGLPRDFMGFPDLIRPAPGSSPISICHTAYAWIDLRRSTGASQTKSYVVNSDGHTRTIE